MYDLKPMSVPEEERLLEIEFYLFISYLLDTYNKSKIAMDVVEALAGLFGCNVTIINNIGLGIYRNESIIIPDREELSVMMYKSGLSIRKIRKRIKVHPQTLYRYVDKYIHAGQLEYAPRLEEDYFLQIEIFMVHLKKIMGWK